MRRKKVFTSFVSFAEHSLKRETEDQTKKFVRENVPDKLRNIIDHSVGKSFLELLVGAAIERIEPTTLQSTCYAIERLLAHEMPPICEGRIVVKRDFGNEKRNVFCVTKYETPFPDEIKRIENSIVELFEMKYNLKIRFGPLTKIGGSFLILAPL